MLPLKGLDWDEDIPSTEQEKWTDIIAMFVELNDIQMPRCCIPSDDESESKIRLIYLADAGEFAGGTVVYAGRKLKSGGWSCSILASKSRLVDATIPRNDVISYPIMYRVSIPSEESARKHSWSDNLLYGLYNCTELVQKPENLT